MTNPRAIITTLILLVSLSAQPCLGYVTPTGHLCFYQSSALQSYLSQVQAVFDASNQFWVALEQPLTSSTSSQQAASVFLERWNILMDLRNHCQDFQLLEFLTEPSPTNRQLANLEIDLVPALIRHTQNRSFHKACQRYLQRPCPEFISLSQVPKWSIEEFQKLSPESIQEYHLLIQEHIYLINTGAEFGDYDLENKQKYLQQLKKVEERWNILFHRCQLMGILNPQYVQTSKQYLANLGYDNERDYHQMRQQNHKKLLVKGRSVAWYKTPEPFIVKEGVFQRAIVAPFRLSKNALGHCKDIFKGWWKRRTRKARTITIDCQEPFM